MHHRALFFVCRYFVIIVKGFSHRIQIHGRLKGGGGGGRG